MISLGEVIQNAELGAQNGTQHSKKLLVFFLKENISEAPGKNLKELTRELLLSLENNDYTTGLEKCLAIYEVSKSIPSTTDTKFWAGYVGETKFHFQALKTQAGKAN